LISHSEEKTGEKDSATKREEKAGEAPAKTEKLF
jgi:hypothetical protein